MEKRAKAMGMWVNIDDYIPVMNEKLPSKYQKLRQVGGRKKRCQVSCPSFDTVENYGKFAKRH